MGQGGHVHQEERAVERHQEHLLPEAENTQQVETALTSTNFTTMRHLTSADLTTE